MQEHIICHCGKCNIKCNKHNKKSKCADCKKIRKLGTVVTKGIMRHICDKCCNQIRKDQIKEQEQLEKTIQEMRDGEEKYIPIEENEQEIVEEDRGGEG